jgi:hypothetical protein
VSLRTRRGDSPTATGSLDDHETTTPTTKPATIPPRTARLDDGPALTRGTIRRLLDDGRIRFALTTEGGTSLLDLGRARRFPNTTQLHALWRRDHGCTMPGCDRTRFLHAHHVTYWTNGGTTDLDNLLLLCGEHHRALHEGAFTITALGHQKFRFATPRGVRLDPAPTIRGKVTDLEGEHPDITPTTIHPDWDGHHLEKQAINGYLTYWKARIRRTRHRDDRKTAA